MPWLCSALRSPHRAWAGDLQQRGSGALPLARLVVTSLWELGTGAMGGSSVAKACDSRRDDHGEDGQQLVTPTTPLWPAPTHDLIQA